MFLGGSLYLASSYKLDVSVSFRYGHDYLSTNDWPFLPVIILFKIKFYTSNP